MLKKAVIYARVSSKEQQQEGFSIPAQLKLLRDYAHKNGLKIAREFSDAETAKKAGRAQFGQMLDYLRQAQVRVIVVEKTDRLYRNFRDYVTIDDVDDLEIHLVKEGEILSKDSKSHQKFIHGIKVLMAKNYIDNLSEEVKKGLYEKAARGQYPGQAPTGYLNIVTENKEHIMGVDGERAPMIQKLFELYATSNYSLDSLHAWARDNGVRSRFGRPLSRGNIERILKNPVYYGDFIYSGKYYKGTHDPIVSRRLWDNVQRAFKKHDKPATRQKHDFIFSGLMTCGGCGSAIRAERKKAKYVYYHCSRVKKDCRNYRNYVREEKLAEQFAGVIKSIRVPEEIIEEIVQALKESCHEKAQFCDEAISTLQKQIALIRKRRRHAYTDKLDGKITETNWEELDKQWAEELSSLEAQVMAYDKADTPYYESGSKILELAKHAHALYLRGTVEEKRELLKLVLSNSQLNGTSIEYQMRNPFHLMAKWASRPAMLGGRDSNPDTMSQSHMSYR